MESLSGLLDTHRAYRRENLVVVPHGATLPRYCVKCGEPTAGHNDPTSFSWHAPWLYVLIFAGALVYIIVAMAVSKKASIMVPMCEEHKRLRRQLLWAGTALLVGGIPVGILSEQILPQIGAWSVFLMILLIVAGLIVISPMRQFLRPTFIDGTRAEFTGGAETFLQHLPPNP